MKVLSKTVLLAALSMMICAGAAMANDQVAVWGMDSVATVGDGNYILDAGPEGNDLRLGDNLAVPEYDAATQPALVAGYSGNALEFDGTDDKAVIIDGWQGWNSVEVEFWVKPGRISGDVQWLAEANDAWSIRQSGANVQFWVIDATGNSRALQSEFDMQVGQWYNVVATCNPDEMTLKVAGYKVSREGHYVTSVVRNISVGANFNSTATRFMQGVIDNMTITSAALEDDAQAAVNDESTIGLWHMEAIVGGMVIDDCNDVDPDRDNNLVIQTYGASIEPGVVGNAISFDGGTQYALDTNGWQLYYEAFEIDFWMNPGNINTVMTVLAVGSSQVEIRQSNDDLIMYIWDTASSARLAGIIYDSLVAGQWHHVQAVLTPEGKTVLTLDGKSNGYMIPNPPIKLASGPISVGATSAGSRPYTGLVDELKVNATRQVDMLSGDWQSPYQDSYNTLGLWHFEGLINVNDEKYVDDDDAGNPDRDQVLRLQQVSNGVAFTATDGPQITNASDYPADNSAFGTCMYFDGVDDNLRTVSADIPVNTNPTDLRVEAWIKPDPSFASGTFGYIYHRRGAVRLGLYLRAGGDMELYHWVVANNGDYSSVSTPLSVYCNPYEWNHVALVVNGGLVRKYVNGQLIYSDNLTEATLKPNTNSWTGFGSYTAAAHWFHGWMDELRVSTAVHEMAPCGFWGYFPGDVNEDCYVDLLDYSQIAREWLGTTDPLLDVATDWTACTDPASGDCANIQF